ncbi:MAG: hypothetical protein PVG83_07575 [Acidimicrobiia bacterium]|jgi:hypothetical protein
MVAAACTDTPSAEDGTTTASTIPPTTPPTFDLANFSMDQIANGIPLDWSQRLSDESLEPAGLLRLSGITYVFATDSTGAGLRAWSSTDGQTWTDLGEILPNDTKLALTDTGVDRLILVTEGRAGKDPEVWSSGDGIDWDTESIPIDLDNGLLAFSPSAAAVTDTMTIVTGKLEFDLEEVVEPYIEETIWPGYDADRYGLDWHTTDEEIRLDVVGPAGLTLLSVTTDELGLSAQTEEWLRADPPDGHATAWVDLDGGGWSPTTIEGATHVTSLSTTSRGAIVAVGLTELEQLALWVSFDGFFWEQYPFDVRPHDIESWEERLVGPAESGGFDILVSDDGLEWDSTGLRNHFPSSQRWFLDAFAAGPTGVAVVGELFERDTGVVRGFELPFIVKGDVEILVDPQSGQVSIYDGTDQYTWRRDTTDLETLQFDPATETVRFEKPNGEELATTTLAELDEAADDFNIAFGGRGKSYRAFAYSNDDGSWAIWDLAALGEQTQPTHVAVSESNFVVATTEHLTGTGFGVWTAEIP